MDASRDLAFHAYVAITKDQVRVNVYEGFPFILSDAMWAALMSAAALALVICGSWFGLIWLLVAQAILLRICSLPGRTAYGEHVGAKS